MAKLKKYQDIPGSTVTDEALHIKINQTKAQIREIQNKRLIASGEGDPFIQSRPTGKSATPTTGKYFARPIRESPMAFDPKMAESLPDLIRLMGVQSRVRSNNTPDVFAEMAAKNLQSGVFADAYKRQGRQPHPLLVAQLSNRNAQEQADAMISGRAINVQPSTAGPTATPDLRKKAGDLPQGEAMTPEQLRLKNKALDEAEARLLGRKAAPANETEDQRLRRMHPELF